MNPTEKLILITTKKELDDLYNYIRDKQFVAFDTETTGLTNDNCEIIGFSICAQEDLAYYVVLAKWTGAQFEYTECKPLAAQFLQSLSDKSLIAHNAVFDCRVIHNNFKVS